EREGQEVGGDGDERPALLGRGDDLPVVAQPARGARLLQDETGEGAVVVGRGQAGVEVGDNGRDADGGGPVGGDGEGLRVELVVEHHGGCLDLLVRPLHEEHGLRDGGGLVEQGGVGDGQGGEVGDGGLEVQQRLEASLGDRRLVGRVGGVPGR